MMRRRQANATILAGAALAAVPAATLSQALQPLTLPHARSGGGMPLTQALKLRRSTREYSDRALTMQVFSDLL